MSKSAIRRHHSGNSNCYVCGSYNWLFDFSKPKQNNIDFSDYIEDYLNYEDDVHLYL